jgi:glyoxylase-like metal-dependent hydrolase (beta-lactamase superfamily II)
MTDALLAGEVCELRPGLRRLVAPNASLMTGPGTNTYLLGTRRIGIIDPGPRIARHTDAIVAAAGAPIDWILVTHTHPDHSPAAAPLAKLTGAKLLGIAAPQGPHQDATFCPDRTLRDGDRLSFDEFDLEVLHTPGHASNHLCYRHVAHRWLFTGDHIINGSTVVIDPPDGSMSQYLASLARLRNEDVDTIAPGHGAPIEAPLAAIDALIAHRLKREAKVVAKLEKRPDVSLAGLVSAVYDEIDPAIHRLAERSLLAHLQKLEEDGRVAVNGDLWRLTGN